jgi:L-arabinose isomerase
MEDYTYHLSPKGHQVLGAHMLEICPSIAAAKPTLEIHPLGIGGKEDPVRLVFDARRRPGRQRLARRPGQPVPPDRERSRRPQARRSCRSCPSPARVWECRPDFKTATGAWILAGGAHHTGYSSALTTEMLEDFAEMAGVELSVIDTETRLRSYKEQLRNNDLYYHLAQGIRG